MKFFCLFLLYLKLFDQVLSDCKKLSSLACAFADIKKSFEPNNQKISIQDFSGKKKIIDSLLVENSKNSKLSFRYQKFAKRQKSYQIDESGILIFDSLKTLSQFNYKSYFVNEGPKDWQFFVFIDKVKAKDIKSAIAETWIFRRLDFRMKRDRTEIIHFQYFLIEEGNFFVLYTFVWYTLKRCGRQQLVEVNRFNKNTRNWKNQKFEIDKFDNFYGCKLTFTYNDYYPEIGQKSNKNRGFQYDLLKEISRTLNFKFKDYHFYYRHKVRFESIDLHLEPHLMCQPQNYKDSRSHLTELYYSTESYLAVPPGAAYSGYEKLLFPFDHPTWALIVLVFVAAFVTIFVINMMTNKIRNFVFGDNVSTPSLNVTAHFFGLAQKVIPKSSFARFLIMILILYCLIIRTAWQSKMFTFMRREMTKPSIKTVDEAHKKFQNEFMYGGDVKLANGSFRKNRHVYSESLYNVVHNSSFNASLRVDSRYLYRHMDALKSTKLLQRILKDEPFDVGSCGFTFPLNHKFYKKFNKVKKIFLLKFFLHINLSHNRLSKCSTKQELSKT
jgi:hypothetical protein